MYLSVNFCVFPTSFIVAFEHHKIIKKWLYLWRTMNLYIYTYIYFYPKLVRLFLGKVMLSASDKVSLHNWLDKRSKEMQRLAHIEDVCSKHWNVLENSLLLFAMECHIYITYFLRLWFCAIERNPHSWKSIFTKPPRLYSVIW